MRIDANISNIKSDYNLKTIFSYLDYPYILKLLKNNENLQNRLGLTLENYKNKSDAKKYEYIKETQLVLHYHYKDDPKTFTIHNDEYKSLVSYMLPSIIPYFLIYSILLVSIKTFKDSNTRDNYNKKYLNIIKTINPCLFIYYVLILLFILIFRCCLIDNFEHDYGKKRKIRCMTMIIFSLLPLLSESLVIWKLVLSYKIKKGGCTWFMVLDYLFLVFNFFYILMVFGITLSYIFLSGRDVSNEIKCSLNSFNNIKINSYDLPEDFYKFSKIKRKKYVFDHYKYYKHTISDEQIELIKSINDFRGIKSIPLLGICEIQQIPSFLINETSEVMLWPEQNIFKLSNKKYLFRYPIGLFKIDFQNKNENITSILMKENLNHIQIITYQNLEYIFIYELDFCIFHRSKLISYSFGKRQCKTIISRHHTSSKSLNYKNEIYYE